MRITEINAQLLHVPTDPPRASSDEVKAGRSNHIVTLVVRMRTDEGVEGIGTAYSLQSSGRAMLVLLEDDLIPLLVDENPLHNERLAAKVYSRLQTVGRRGLVQQAYSALDLALWDIKGKVAGMPVYQLLGGMRESSQVYGSNTGWLWMSVDEILEASRTYLDQGFVGIKVKLGKGLKEDAQRVELIREAFGDDVWLGVDANQRYAYVDAFTLGSYLEEEVAIDWLEEPITCEDVVGHQRLAKRLAVPIACGEMLFGRDEFERYLERDAMQVMQPDITRVGGITEFLKIAGLANQYGVPIAPHLQPEVAVHLACGLPQVTLVEYMPWTYPILKDPPAIENGEIVPPSRPGLGLELNTDAVAKYQAK